MNTVRTLPEFAGLSELEIQAAIDAYDAAAESAPEADGEAADGDDGQDDDLLEQNPIAGEFLRLVNAYTERMDELIRTEKDSRGELSEGFLAGLLSYEPQTAMERAAFDFVTGIFLDVDDGED